MSDIKVIIFDLDGVVFENGTRRTKEFFKKEYFLDENLLNSIFYGKEAGLFRNGKLNSRDFWDFVDSIIAKEKLSINKEEFKNIWYNSYIPIKGIFELLDDLRKNYELGIVSGNIEERILFLDDKYGFRKYFDWEVYSFNVGANKPDIKIYQEIFNKTNVASENCLYIDDKDIFIEPARMLGMHALLFENYPKLLKDLGEIGIINKK